MTGTPGPDFTPWPDDVADRYRREGYWQGTTLDDLMQEWAVRHAYRTALVADDDRLTYVELNSRIDRLAVRLGRLGIGTGHRVVVQLPNIVEFVVLCFALFRRGALPVLALPAHRSNEINYLCQISDAIALVIADRHTGFDYRPLAKEALAHAPDLRHVLVVGEPGDYLPLEVDAHDAVHREAVATAADGPRVDSTAVAGKTCRRGSRATSGSVALFLLSGGTTGLPKLIPRTHDDYVYNVRASAAVCGFDNSTVYLAALPVSHNFPFGCPGILGTFHAGGTVVLATSPAPPDAFPLIERERVTVTALVPPLVMLWMEAAAWTRRDLSSLRLLQVGGAKFKQEAAQRVRATLDCQLQQVFGMAEGLLCYTRLDDPDETIVSTQGRPMSAADEILVVDTEGRQVAPGEIGELHTRGPYTLRGYYRAEDYNAGAFTADGFYRTGDLVRVTETGHLIVDGRVKDIINRGGEKISAEEVENHLLAHHWIRDAALVGMPDDVLGERSCIYVIPRDRPPTLPELVGFLRSRGLADYKLPDRLEIVDAFHRTGVGKVSKKALVADITAKLVAEKSAREKRETEFSYPYPNIDTREDYSQLAQRCEPIGSLSGQSAGHSLGDSTASSE